MPLHYNYAYDPLANSYVFTTRNSILYRVSFSNDNTFSSLSGKDIPNIFQLVIEKVSAELEPYDIRVSRTIETIVEHFFQNIQNAVIYVCDDFDSKAKMRFKVFDNWYKKSKYKDDVVKMDNIIRIETTLLYTSFLFHKENPYYETLVKIYMQMEKLLNEDK